MDNWIAQSDVYDFQGESRFVYQTGDYYTAGCLADLS